MKGQEKSHRLLPDWSVPKLVILGHETTEAGKRRKQTESVDKKGRVRGPS